MGAGVLPGARWRSEPLGLEVQAVGEFGPGLVAGVVRGRVSRGGGEAAYGAVHLFDVEGGGSPGSASSSIWTTGSAADGAAQHGHAGGPAAGRPRPHTLGTSPRQRRTIRRRGDRPRRWIAVLRRSHDDLAARGGDDDRRGPPPCLGGASEWDVSQVLSHLGSGAEIALRGLEASLADGDPPAEDYHAVWDRWNAIAEPAARAEAFIAADERHVSAWESLDVARWPRSGPLPLPAGAVDAATAVGLRLSEHTLHSWDVHVATDPAAPLAPMRRAARRPAADAGRPRRPRPRMARPAGDAGRRHDRGRAGSGWTWGTMCSSARKSTTPMAPSCCRPKRSSDSAPAASAPITRRRESPSTGR